MCLLCGLCTDEFNLSSAVNVTWAMHTHATTMLASGDSTKQPSLRSLLRNEKVQLMQDGSTATVQVLEHPNKDYATGFTAVPITFAAPMLLDNNVSRLQLVYPAEAICPGNMMRLVVAVATYGPPPNAVNPLSLWNSSSGPFGSKTDRKVLQQEGEGGVRP